MPHHRSRAVIVFWGDRKRNGIGAQGQGSVRKGASTLSLLFPFTEKEKKKNYLKQLGPNVNICFFMWQVWGCLRDYLLRFLYFFEITQNYNIYCHIVLPGLERNVGKY